MSKIDDGGSAFPEAQRLFDNDTQSWVVMSKGGMSLRDYFAAAALSGLMHNPSNQRSLAMDDATYCYAIADAMLAARKESSHDVA